MEIFKTLEFSDARKTILGKYAHPLKVEGGFEWGGSSMPLLMTKDINRKEIKSFYKGLDFRFVKIVEKRLVDF